MFPAILITGNSILSYFREIHHWSELILEPVFICAYCFDNSCSPNLSTRLVLVESKDCQLAHIGLFANQDVRFFLTFSFVTYIDLLLIIDMLFFRLP